MRDQPANQINVSTKKNANFYVFLGKKYLEEHEIIELHALGNAVSISVIAAENLVRFVLPPLICYVETITPSSRKSKPRLSQWTVSKETARRQSCSSPSREAQISRRTWISSTRSKKKTTQSQRKQRKPSSECVSF